MNTNKFFIFFLSKKSFWGIVGSVTFLLIFLVICNFKLAVIPTIILTILLIYHYKNRKYVREDFEKYVEELSLDMGIAAQNAMIALSMPISVITIKGEIVWKNSFFSEQITEENLEAEFMLQIINKKKEIKNKKDDYDLNIQIELGTRSYNVIGKSIKKFDGIEDRYLILYFHDNTEIKKYKKKSFDEKLVISIIVMDNYDDLMQSMEDTKRPQMLAEVDARVVAWSNFTGGIIKKYERDKYLFIFQHQFLKELEEKKFDVLDSVKEINLGNKIPVTLSIGIDNSDENFSKSFQYAIAALDIALGRGGDQVVVREGDKIKFYGGKTREVEKRTKVKARVMAHALKGIIIQASQVMIMGHANCDVDALGAAMGVHKIALSLGRTSNIVLDSSNTTIDNYVQRINQSIEHEGIFISIDEAKRTITSDTLLVIVDTHRPAYTECPELFKITKHVVIIDHHRRGADFIQDAVLTYQEPYASSTCELVTEIIQYINEHIKLEILDAELLYSGIVVDTKNFIFKTGVRTFEAAAYLRKIGVDTVHVKQLLQHDLESYINISDIVKEVKIIHENIAISKCPSNVMNSPLIIAKAADEILSIAGISAAFVISESSSGISISGRSFGEVNVQVILEKIGGGGHQTVAGAQFNSESMDSVVEKLMGAIEDYIKEVTKEP
jgi:c-di-AMP phosphodiesterase-like protein